MQCPYVQIGSYFGFCKCTIDGGQCGFVYRCPTERKWLPLDGMNSCTLKTKSAEVKPLKPNEHRVRFESKGKLYVEYNDSVYTVENPFDYTPQGVEACMVDGRLYIKGYEPQPKVIEDIQKEEEKLMESESDTKKKSRRTNKKKR